MLICEPNRSLGSLPPYCAKLSHTSDKMLNCSCVHCLCPSLFLHIPLTFPSWTTSSLNSFFCPQDGPSVLVPEEMSLGRLLRRASSKASDLLTFNPGAGGTSLRSGLDGEIIFSKNNVCVHPAEPLPGLAEHHPG